jgi:hypothetical protein
MGNFVALYTPPVPTKKEVTLMIIKPDAVKAGKVDEIIEQVYTYSCYV